MIPNAKSEDIRKFWRHVLGGESGLLHVWTGKRDAEGVIDKETIVSNSFNYPDAAESAATWALKKSSEGREVYFCAHLLTNPRRIKENAAPVRSLWGDLDGAPVPNGELKPTAVVESSPGRYHCYWRLDSEIPPDVAEDLNKRIAAVIGADPSGFDRTQLLRVPDTTNHKYPDAPVVALKDLAGGRSYSPADLDNLLPTSEKPRAEHQASEDSEGQPPIVLSPEARKVWRGEALKLKEGGEVDRSATLLHIGRVLYDAGGNRRVVVEGVRERDAALGFHKYTNNRGGGQREYERIFEKLAENGRNDQVKVIHGGRQHKEEPVEGDGLAGDDTVGRPGLPMELLLTDLGNAIRFARRFEGQLVYSPALGGYGEYRGGRYVRDDLGKRFERAKSVPLEFMVEASNISAADPDTAKKYAKHGIASAARPRLESMVALAHSDPRIAVASEDLDGDPYLFNCASGTIDLRTGKLRPHDQGDRLTKISPVRYREGAGCPAWLRFLEEILPEPELRAFMKRWFGWCLTGIVNAEVLPIFYGTGANGKSTLTNVLLEVLGDYGQQAPQDLLMVKRRDHPTELADLFGRRLVASAEIEEGVRLNESLVKQLTGRERVRARYMRQDFFEFDPTHKLVLLTNHKPTIRGSDKGIWRRLKVVPFEVTIPDTDQDKDLADKLREELPGILAWAVEGCLEWRREGLGEPQKVRDASAEYQSEQDVIGTFLDECCEIVEDNAAYTLMRDLYPVYQEWCKRSREFMLKKQGFGDRLTERGFPPERGTGNKPIRRRITLRADAPRPEGGGPRLNFSEGNSGDGSSYPQNSNYGPDKDNNAKPEGNSRVTRVTLGKTQNSCKTEQWEEVVTSSYPQYGMNANMKPSREGDIQNWVTPGNWVTQEVTPGEGNEEIEGRQVSANGSSAPKRRLTEEEAREVRKLIGEGMEASFARAAVLGEEVAF
jgi:P4 family phage/plasmid primase-like protien